MLTPRPVPTLIRPDRWEQVGLGAAILIGAVLRAAGAGAGAPYRFGIDEPFIISNALRMLRTGDFNPHFFDYGGLSIYLHAAAAAVAFLVGAMQGRWNDLNAVWEGDLLIPGRLLSAAFGVLTILFTYRVARRWGPTVAVPAAMTMAILPAHVREAHFILTDTPLTAFIGLALLLSVRIIERGRLVDVAWAAVAVGLATAVKYNGGVALLMPLVAALTLPRTRRLAGLALCPAVAGGTFLMCAPYTVLDLPGFLNGVGLLLQSYNQNRPLGEAMGNYLAYLRNWFSWPGVLPVWLGYGALILVLVGFVSLLGDGSRLRRAAAGLAVLFSLTYFYFVSTQSLQYGRYLLPIGPMVALGLAAGLNVVASRANTPLTRRIVRIVATVLVLALPTASAISWNRTHALTTTAELTAQWLTDHATPADRIVVEAPRFHLPPRLAVTSTARLVDRSFEQYVQDGVTLLVASSEVSDRYNADPARNGAAVAAHRELLARSTPLIAVVPSAEHPGPTLTVLRLPRAVD